MTMRKSSINILITAGGTSEPIDHVRSISNTGTGRLGSLIADAFSLEASVNRIFYICAKNSVRPSANRVSYIEIQSVDDLQSAVTEITKNNPIHVMIHSMAVSDYKVRSVSTVESLASFLRGSISNTCNLQEEILRGLDATDVRTSAGKLSSQMQSPVILLEPTTKVLPLLRGMVPDAVIMGFKLLDQVSKDDLLDTAYRLLIKNGCDFVLANDSAQIDGDRHCGYLIDASKNIQTFQTKQEIANGIVNTILREVSRR